LEGPDQHRHGPFSQGEDSCLTLPIGRRTGIVDLGNPKPQRLALDESNIRVMKK
jgi:hypothetical protein